MVGAADVAEQPNNVLRMATRYELSFKKGDLILSCWFSAGCGDGDRFCRDSLISAAERTAHAKIGGFTLGRIPTTVIASRRRHTFMANYLLDRRQVGASVTLSRRYMSDACRVV